MKKPYRIIFAVFASPVALVPVFFVFNVAYQVTQSDQMSIANALADLRLGSLLEEAIMSSALCSVIVWIGALVIGVPTYIYCRNRGIAIVGRCALVGGIAGLLFGLLFLPYWPIVVLTASSGISVAATFCLIAGRRFPDNGPACV